MVELLGERFTLSREGTDGDIQQALTRLKALDGKVDAIGLGGIDIYLYAGKKRYTIKDGWQLMQAAPHTPVVDGSGLKNTLERETINYLVAGGYINPGSKVLMVSAVDRFGMAEALTAANCDIIFGDIMFGIGIPIAIRSLTKLELLAHRLLPIVTKIPFHLIYPVGNQQERQRDNSEKYARHYQWADIIAGDFHFIRKYLPNKLNGQMIITNTTTPADVELLTQRGAGLLVTTTPEFSGRSFGTNMMEAVLVAMLAKKWDDITPAEYTALLQKLNLKPRIVPLNDSPINPLATTHH